MGEIGWLRITGRMSKGDELQGMYRKGWTRRERSLEFPSLPSTGIRVYEGAAEKVKLISFQPLSTVE